MPRGRNAKEARRAKREKPRSGPGQQSGPPARISHYDSDDSDQEMDLHDLMTFAVMARVMQHNLGFDSDSDDSDVPIDYEPSVDDMDYFESGGSWPPPSMMFQPGGKYGPPGSFGAGGPFTIGALLGVPGFSPPEGYGGCGGASVGNGGCSGAFHYSGHNSNDRPRVFGLPDPDVEAIEAIHHKLSKKRKLKRKHGERRAKIENLKNWTVKPRTWGPSDMNNILLIKLQSSKVDVAKLTPEKITEIVMYNNIFQLSSESPRLNLEKKLFAVRIDKSADMHESLKLKNLSLDVKQSECSDGDTSNSDIDDSLVDETVAVHCFRPQAKTKDERWWEDCKKCIIVNQHKPLTFSNEQIFEESHLHSIVSWSAALKRDDEFFLGLCQRCSNFSSPSRKMVVCNACHLVAYCNKNCLKKDRNHHKKLCSEYSVNHCNMNVFERAQLEVCNISSPEKRKEFFFIFLCHIDANSEMLSAKPLGNEKLDYIKNVCYALNKPFFRDCLQYPRICNVCCKADKNKLKECECYCVAYCSEEHRATDIEHKLVCKDLLKIARVYAFCKKKSWEEQNIFLPHDLGNYQGVNVISKPLDSMDDLVHPRHFPSGSQPDEWLDVKLALLSQRLAMPLTILNLIEKGGLGPDKKSVNAVEKLNIHILCEQPFLDSSSWEFFLHRLPQLKNLNLIFCTNNTNPGGSINHLNTCKRLQRCHNCEEAGRLITFTFYPGMYEHLLNKDGLEKPDIVYVIDPDDLILYYSDDYGDFDDSIDDEMDVNRELFYRNLTKFENSGLIIANECKKKMLIAYRGLCKCRSVQLVKLNGFSYDRKNPFSGFSHVRRKFDNRSHQEVISNTQLYVVYLTRRAEDSEERDMDASDIWDVDDNDDNDDDDDDDDQLSDYLDYTSDGSDLPELIDEGGD